MSKTEAQMKKIRRNLLDAINAAMEAHDELIPCHDKYEPYLEDLVPSTNGFTVDEQKFRDFHNVLYFMLSGTFGVDGSDGKSQPNVYFHLTDRQRYPAPWFVELPYLHKIRDGDQIAWSEILRTATLRVSSAMSDLERVNRVVESEMKNRGGKTRRLRRAKGCANEDCRRGLVSVKFKEKKSFKETCTEFQRNHLYLEPYPDGGHKVLCPVCQTQEREDERRVEEEEAEALR